MDLTGKKKQVQGLLRRGVPDGEIRESLRSEGFSEEEITEIFKPKRYDMRDYYLIASIAIILCGVYMLPGLLGILIMLIGGLMLYEYRRETLRVKQEQQRNQ